MRLKAVLLAAGAGRRFGGSKLTVPLGGRPLLTYAVDAALAAPVDEVVLVTGFHAEAVVAAARAHAADAFASGRLRCVHAPDADEGMGASLRAGVAAAGEADGLFVFLADMAAVPHDVATALAARLEEGVDAVAPVFQGRRGHPVLVSAALAPRLLHLRGDRGAGALLAEPGVRLVTVDANEVGVVTDVDTPADLAVESGPIA